MALKVATWSLKHADRLIDGAENDHTTHRRRRVVDTILKIAPGIPCLVEGAKVEQTTNDFCAEVLEYRYAPVLLKQQSDGLGDRKREYQIKDTQWIWFFVKIYPLPRCTPRLPKYGNRLNFNFSSHRSFSYPSSYRQLFFVLSAIVFNNIFKTRFIFLVTFEFLLQVCDVRVYLFP